MMRMGSNRTAINIAVMPTACLSGRIPRKALIPLSYIRIIRAQAPHSSYMPFGGSLDRVYYTTYTAFTQPH